MTDLEAIQQYEKMLSIQEALMGAEGDVNVEETTGVSCLSACMHTNIATYVCNHIMYCGHNMYIPTYIATLMIRYYLHILANKQLCMYVIVRLIV